MKKIWIFFTNIFLLSYNPSNNLLKKDGDDTVNKLSLFCLCFYN